MPEVVDMVLHAPCNTEQNRFSTFITASATRFSLAARDIQTGNYVLRASKGFSQTVSERAAGLSKTKDSIVKDLAAAKKIGRLTYLFKADPSENGAQYYNVLHPERGKEPRSHRAPG